VVAQGVVKKLETYYSHYLGNPSTQLQSVYDQKGEHSFLTENYGSECDYLGKPYINDCDYDAAGIMLQHLYNYELSEPVDDDIGLSSGSVIAFDQRQFIDEAYTLEEAALNDIGYVYVPNQCQGASAGCRTNSSRGPASPRFVCVADCSVHVAFHGCEQTVWDIGETYVLDTGYNRWAAANNLIVLYPQVRAGRGLDHAQRRVSACVRPCERT
jgi:hypothetical protein